MRRLRVAATLALLTVPVFGTNYYVSTGGSDGNVGTPASSPWRHIAYAAGKVAAGDTVFVKAGNYGKELITFNTSGTSTAPIVFQGYKSSPGDNPDLKFQPGMAFDASVMPLIDGGNRASGTGMTVSGSYIAVRNFQIMSFNVGLVTTGHDELVENILVRNIGNADVNYSGVGIKFTNRPKGKNCVARNCLVYNSCSEGISVATSGCLVQNCKVYCDDASTEKSPTDYYFIIGGPKEEPASQDEITTGSMIRDSYAERIGDLAHGGHGFIQIHYARNNRIVNCTAKGFAGDALSFKYPGSQYNEFDSCRVIGSGHALVPRVGATHNTFRNCWVDGAAHGISAWNEKLGEVIEDTRFINCVFANVQSNVFYFNPYHNTGNDDGSSPVKNNAMVNCVIYRAPVLFNVGRANSGNTMVNCIVSDVTDYKTGSRPLDMSFDHCDFYDNGFAAPAGTGIIEENPLFVNANGGEFNLQQGSPCIDAGVTDTSAAFDFEGTRRPEGEGYDIGAFEYKLTTALPQLSMPWTGASFIPAPGFKACYDLRGRILTPHMAVRVNSGGTSFVHPNGPLPWARQNVIVR
jgi:hypothetical protein